MSKDADAVKEIYISMISILLKELELRNVRTVYDLCLNTLDGNILDEKNKTGSLVENVRKKLIEERSKKFKSAVDNVTTSYTDEEAKQILIERSEAESLHLKTLMDRATTSIEKIFDVNNISRTIEYKTYPNYVIYKFTINFKYVGLISYNLLLAADGSCDVIQEREDGIKFDVNIKNVWKLSEWLQDVHPSRV